MKKLTTNAGQRALSRKEMCDVQGGRAPYRIKWKIPGHGEGHGDWHLTKDGLTSLVDYGNKKYGKGTHWIEEITL